MENQSEITLATFSNVIIYKIGEKGAKHKYEPSKVTIYTNRSRSYKGWIIARNHAGNSMNFNAYIPGNCPIVLKEKQREIYFGKVPSLSFVNKAGKPIPTMWTFKMANDKDLQSVYGFLLMFAKLAAVVNALPPPTTLFSKKKRTVQVESPVTTLTDRSVNLLEESENEDDDDETVLSNKEEEEKTNDEESETGSKYLFSPLSYSSDVFAESQDIFEGTKSNENGGDGNNKENEKYIKNKKEMAENNKKLQALLLSPLSESSGEPGSPVFAESQDILGNVGQKMYENGGYNKYMDCFSPFSDDEPTY